VCVCVCVCVGVRICALRAKGNEILQRERRSFNGGVWDHLFSCLSFGGLYADVAGLSFFAFLFPIKSLQLSTRASRPSCRGRMIK
jgi:hypothetical protein